VWWLARQAQLRDAGSERIPSGNFDQLYLLPLGPVDDLAGEA
jgi:hypothetical protein